MKDVLQTICTVLTILLFLTVSGCSSDDSIFDDSIDEDAVVHIPDDALKEKIYSDLNITYGLVTQKDMLHLIELEKKEIPDVRPKDWPLYNVSDLTGLEYAKNLKVINLWKTNVPDLSPISGLNKLEALRFSDNLITDVTPLGRLKNLKGLDIHGNNIKDITPFKGLNTLSHVDFSDNYIRDVSPLMELENLEYLNIEGNPLSVASITKFIPRMESAGVEVDYSNIYSYEVSSRSSAKWHIISTKGISLDELLYLDDNNEKQNYETSNSWTFKADSSYVFSVNIEGKEIRQGFAKGLPKPFTVFGESLDSLSVTFTGSYVLDEELSIIVEDVDVGVSPFFYNRFDEQELQKQLRDAIFKNDTLSGNYEWMFDKDQNYIDRWHGSNPLILNLTHRLLGHKIGMETYASWSSIE